MGGASVALIGAATAYTGSLARPYAVRPPLTAALRHRTTIMRPIDTSTATRVPATSPPDTNDPNRATPTTLPVCRAVLSVPDANPARSDSTLPSCADVIVGTMTPMPDPSVTSCATTAA